MSPSRSPRLNRFRCFCVAGLVLFGVSCFVGTNHASAQTTIDLNYRLHFATPGTVAVDSVFPVDVLFDVEMGAPQVSGLSLGICHDPTRLAPQSAVSGPVLDTIKNGAPADFIDVQADPTLGATFGLIICFTGCATLAGPETNLVLMTIDVAAVGSNEGLTLLEYCDTVAIGGNPVPTSIVTTAASSSTPITEAGEITIVVTNFLRGDCDADGSLTIADAVGMLGQLFDGGPLMFPCEDACDVNDDAGLNIADPVRILSYLFSGGLAPPAPFPDCGTDPSVDPLGCEAPSQSCAP